MEDGDNSANGAGHRNRIAIRNRTGITNGKCQPRLQHAFVACDHSRRRLRRDLPHETAASAAAVLRRAVDWFADRGVAVELVLSDNGPA